MVNFYCPGPSRGLSGAVSVVAQYDDKVSVPTKPAREAKAELIKRMSVAEEVLRILHEWIISGKVNPGDKLPSQDKLAEQFDVSRNTIREPFTN